MSGGCEVDITNWQVSQRYWEDFKNVKHFYADFNKFTEFPPHLPKGIETVSIAYNKLRSIPDNLPNSIKILRLKDNKIKEFPARLPKRLEELDLSKNQITEVPENLPESLKVLWLDGNPIREIPKNLPRKLRILDLSNTLIEELSGEDLPETLEYIDISGGTSDVYVKKFSNLTLPNINIKEIGLPLALWFNTLGLCVSGKSCLAGIFVNVFTNINNPLNKCMTLEAMSYRLSIMKTKHLDDMSNIIKGRFELWSLREEGARFKRAQREYEELFG